ncbi:MAG: hypothetical protein HC916_07720 [Coleofasciculaceae cyanobacterium SM2_1_6]|nr:hypothetical protein [Coleofasciculaceae cyanobacterium SM2_1_6]
MMKNMIVNAGMSISANINEGLGKLSSVSFASFSSSNGIVTKGQVAIVALILSLGITSATTSIKSLATEMPELTGSSLVNTSLVTPTTNLPPAPTLAADSVTGNITLPTSGTYLYGQAPVAGQLGQEYVVFEVLQGRVVGALYMPSSEFSCFQGTLTNNQMNVTVANSYDNSAFIHQIAQGEQDQRLAAVGGGSNLLNEINSLTYPHELELDNYHRISDVSANDQRLLAACQARYQ